MVLGGFDTTSCLPGGVSFGTSPNGPNLPHQAHLTYLTRPLDNRPQDVSGGPLQYWTNEGKERDRKTDRQPDRQTDRDS